MCDLKTKGREWSGIENSLASRREAEVICSFAFNRIY